MHTFAKYLFTSLLPHDAELAYRIALRAMRYVFTAQQGRRDAHSPLGQMLLTGSRAFVFPAGSRKSKEPTWLCTSGIA